MNKSSFIGRNKYIIGSVIAFSVIGFLVYKVFGTGKAKLKKPNPKKILFVGDSISAIKDSNGNSITSTYPNYVKQALTPLGVSVDVLAKGGQPTSWMVQNLPTTLQNKFDRVYIYGGVNDAWNSSIKPNVPLENIQKMIDMINQSGADAFVITGYEPYGFMDYIKMPITRYQNDKKDNIPLIKEYADFQVAIPKIIKNATIIPKFNLGNRTGDGIHPNAEGQKMIAEIIKKTI
jgi:lysophospholipase L1-like esterase